MNSYIKYIFVSCKKNILARLKYWFLSFLVLIWATPAWAIPSPELVIGSISSVSQLFALVSALLGGGAVAIGARAAVNGRSKSAMRVAMVLLALFILSLGFNLYQYHTATSAKQARLEATLIRPAKLKGQKLLDATLKETSFGNQKNHSLGISTEETARLLAETKAGIRDDVVFVDVRETGEHEMGTLPNATHIRYPDIPTANISLKNKTAVLLCHNGNRSSETCEVLAAKGIDCRFIVGGIEKWIVEGRDFTDKNVRGLSDLRAIPQYENRDVLLDTPDVQTLVSEEKALFLDVRYPGEYANRHLPGAINIPIRKTPTSELMDQISKLPKRPIVTACYDRRGCFMSQVLGLELSRAGYDFRGRYTLPWEYFEKPKPKPHVQAWIANQKAGVWADGVEFVAGLIEFLAEKWSMIAAIVIAALVSRMLVIPVSLKAEKDQIKMHLLQDELDDLKTRLKDDPQRRAKALSAFYKDHGITPVRNLLALAFVPVMALNLSAIQQVATARTGETILGQNMATPDATFILPALFGLLGVAYILYAVAKKPIHKHITWFIGLPLLFGIAALLSVAGQLYLIVSMILLLLQRGFATGYYRRTVDQFVKYWKSSKAESGVIPLAFTDQLASCGNKAYRLSQLRSMNVSVPDGVVLTEKFLNDYTAGKVKSASLNQVWKSVSSEKVAVRSSAAAEDGSANSFAGVFESVLNVTRHNLEDAIHQVTESFKSERAGSYGQSGEGNNILVQRMVEAEFAGVLFTQAPEETGLMMVEMVKGLAEDLVSGTATPDSFFIGRFSGQVMGGVKPPIDLSELFKMGMEIENHFQTPQDIEWTYRNGQFIIVQSRDITVTGSKAKQNSAEYKEWRRLFEICENVSGDEIVLVQDEMSEVLPRPTPLSFSLMQGLWSAGGSVERASKRLGVSYPIEGAEAERLATVFGRLYTNRRVEIQTQIVLNRASINYLKTSGEQLEKHFSDEFLPKLLSQVELYSCVDFKGLSRKQLKSVVLRLIDDFTKFTHTEVEVVNIAANFYIEFARKQLEKRKIDPASVLKVDEKSGPARILSEIASCAETSRLHLLKSEMGHRAIFDYELREPRYLESPDVLAELVTPFLDKKDKHGSANDLDRLPAKLKKLVISARRFQILKEEAKHHSLKHYALIRKALLEFGNASGLGDLIFYLTIDELREIDASNLSGLAKIGKLKKKNHAELLKHSALPTAISPFDLERASAKCLVTSVADDCRIVGKRVSGSGTAEGNCRVMTAQESDLGAPIRKFKDGDILVCSMVHPAWLPYVLRSGGVICEVGGWLSHIAIVARENDITMIVNTQGLGKIVDGSHVIIDNDGVVECENLLEIL